MSQMSRAASIPSLEQSRLPPLAVTLGKFFDSRGVSAHLVGGALRDALLSRQSGDIDVAVAGDVEPVGSAVARLVGGRVVPLDPDRGILRIALSAGDVPSFIDLNRVDGSIEDDLSRRDFTVDAMALPLGGPAKDGEDWGLVDPFGGQEDLRARVIRAVSLSVFQEDPARLMRAPRLCAQLGFYIADSTSQRIRRDARLVTAVAPERLRDEFLKLLAAPEATPSLRSLDELGLLGEIIPELSAARGVTQPAEHYWNVFDHCLETVGQVERLLERGGDDWVVALTPRFDSIDEYFRQNLSDGHSRLTLLKVAGLLHDIAKPATRTVESSGRIRFLGHNRQGARVVREIMQRLRFSRRGDELVSRMVESHLRPTQMARAGEMPTDRAVHRYYRDVGDAAVDTLYLNMADHLAARGPMLREREWADHCRIVSRILRAGRDDDGPAPPRRLVDGHSLMEVFSLGPGPHIGRLLELVSEAQLEGEISTKDEALALVGAALDQRGGNGAPVR